MGREKTYNRTRFLLRPSEDMHNQIKSLAKDSGRSINSQYMHIVNTYIEKKESKEYFASTMADEQHDAFYGAVDPDDQEAFNKLQVMIDKVFFKLGRIIYDTEMYVSSLEANLYATKTFFDNEHNLGIRISLDSIKDKANALVAHNKILKEMKKLWLYFEPLSTAMTNQHALHPQTGVITVVRNAGKYRSAMLFVKENLDKINLNFVDANNLIRESERLKAKA